VTQRSPLGAFSRLNRAAVEDHEAITMTAEHAIAALVLMTPPALR
jgi:hypothetical protein